MQKWQPDAFAPDISLASGLLCFVWSISVIISIYIQVCFLSTLTSMAVSRISLSVQQPGSTRTHRPEVVFFQLGQME